MTTPAGSIGVIIPPSITFVIFGCITGLSIGKLFIAGIVPGILMGTLLGVAAILGIRKSPEVKKLPKASWKERWVSFKDAFWGLMMPVIILGGIYGGIFTPTESAAVSAIYGLFVGFFIYRSIKLKDLYSILLNSLSQTATVMFIMATAGMFSWIMTVEGLADRAGALMVTLSFGSKYLFLLLLNIVLLIAGCLLDGASALYILTPIFYTVAINLGIDPIHLGVVAIVNLAIGMITPPVGVDLFVACGIGNISIKEIVRGNMPFLIASLLALLLITYIPFISTFLPNLMK